MYCAKTSVCYLPQKNHCLFRYLSFNTVPKSPLNWVKKFHIFDQLHNVITQQNQMYINKILAIWPITFENIGVFFSNVLAITTLSAINELFTDIYYILQNLTSPFVRILAKFIFAFSNRSSGIVFTVFCKFVATLVFLPAYIILLRKAFHI